MKIHSLNRVLTLAFLSLVAACASISKEECLSGNWEQIGYKDANRGDDRSRVGAHMEACGKHGIQVNRELYDKGFEGGLKEFCTFDRGLQFGRDGRYYKDTCPPELAGEFRRGFQLGGQINKVESQIKSLDSEIQTLEQAMIKEPVAYERRRIASDISTKRALISTLRVQVTILETQLSGTRRH